LLDNDGVTEDVKRHLEKEVGRKGAHCYWSLFEQLRSELGYADYLGALQRYRSERPHDPNLLTVSLFLIDYPFADRLFPNTLGIAIMCAEAVPWRCHRSLIADALLVRGICTEDIMSPIRRTVHTLTPFAKVRGTTITYPAEVSPEKLKKSSSQRSARRPLEHLIHTRT